MKRILLIFAIVTILFLVNINITIADDEPGVLIDIHPYPERRIGYRLDMVVMNYQPDKLVNVTYRFIYYPKYLPSPGGGYEESFIVSGGELGYREIGSDINFRFPIIDFVVVVRADHIFFDVKGLIIFGKFIMM